MAEVELIELGRALSELFGQGQESPSHNELTAAFHATGLAAGDPEPASPKTPIGKVRRVREVFNYATDHDPSAGLRLARRLIPSLRATNAFVPETPGYAGEQRIATLRAAFRRIGWDLDETGGLRPLVVDNLTGTELTEALRSYVQRANLNPDDASLQVGNGKDLDEAAARHVINELAGSYSTSANFPYTLTQAFTLLQLAPAAASTAATLDPDPHKAVQQCLFQLACAVNRLRNEVGTGHGRPAPAASALTPSETHVVTRATALVAGLLLDNL